MLDERQRLVAELKSFVADLAARDPELMAELKQRAAAPPPDDADPAVAALYDRIGRPESVLGAPELAFESIVLRQGRPVLAIQNDDINIIVGDPETRVLKSRLDAAKPLLRRAIPAVGRIEVANNPYVEWVGTGWLVAPDVIVTNRHVALLFGTRDNTRFVFQTGRDPSRPQAARIDFREEIGSDRAREVPITDILYIAPNRDPDIAFLKVARPGGLGRLAPPIPLTDVSPADGAHVAVIGYPARDSRVPDSELMDRLYGDVYNKKRLAPGQVIGRDGTNLLHDCTTLGGNSGSVVLDLATGAALGLHVSGAYLRANYAVPAAAVARLLKDRPWQGSAGKPRPSAVGPRPLAPAAAAPPPPTARDAGGENPKKRGAKASCETVADACPERRTIESFMLETNGGGALENVPGFNDRRAMTTGFQSTRLPGPEPIFVGYRPDTGGVVPPLTPPPHFGVNLESVIGSDDRVLIPDTTPTPWRCVCQLVITYEGGLQGFGTGWLLGARTVVTAGHCLHDPNTGKKALQVQVVPGRNGASAPFGFLVASDFQVCEGWPDRNDPCLDFGAIFLTENTLTPRIGWFGVGCFPDDELEHLLVNNTGYPYDPRKPFGTQWFNGGRIQSVEAGFVSYMIDTEGGQSGSPVFFFDPKTKQRQVVAIHTTGHFPNRGIRVTTRVFRHLQRWREGP